MPYPHPIRLHGPWEIQALARWLPATEVGPLRETTEHLPPPGRVQPPCDWGATLGHGFRGRVRYMRRFGRPTNLDARERVWLVIEGVDARGDVALNGQPLGVVRGYAQPSEFDVTERLLPRNELEIIVATPPGASAALRPGREHLPGGLLRDIRLEVRHENHVSRLAIWADTRHGDRLKPALRDVTVVRPSGRNPRSLCVATTTSGPNSPNMNLLIAGGRRELAFVPIQPGVPANFDINADCLPRWRQGSVCQLDPVEVRLLRGGEAVWENAYLVAIPEMVASAADGDILSGARYLDQIPRDEELAEYDARGQAVVVSVPLAWADEVCGRLAHHPSIVAWSDPEGQAAPQMFGRDWIPRPAKRRAP